MLIVHQAINNWLCLMQVWIHDVRLDNTPKFQTENPTNQTHAISMTDTDGNNITIHFSLHGVAILHSHQEANTRGV